MRDIAWAIVVLAGAVVFAAGMLSDPHPTGGDSNIAQFVGGAVALLALLPLLVFRRRDV